MATAGTSGSGRLAVPGGKAVTSPGRGKPGKPLREWLKEAKASAEKSETAGLPLFDWAEQKQRPMPTDA